MHSFAPIRFTAVASLALSASLLAQSPPTPQANPPVSTQPPSSTLPATSPTTAPAPPPPIPLTPAQLPPQRARVTFADGMLSISADNASLNQILRQIATDTGLKITGGVADERVFGEYGPAPTDQILAALLDGTACNMILVHRDGDTSEELILTARQGGPTPPSPTSAAYNEDRSEPRQTPPPIQVAQPAPEPLGAVNPANQVNPPATPGAASTGTSPSDQSQPESPNGVKTPQQIYEQLQRMRQQQQQQQQQTKPQ